MPRSTRPKAPRKRKSRAQGFRTRTGCLTCRRRHLKCDEQKPRCAACSLGDRNCTYPVSSADECGLIFSEASPSPTTSINELGTDTSHRRVKDSQLQYQPDKTQTETEKDEQTSSKGIESAGEVASYPRPGYAVQATHCVLGEGNNLHSSENLVENTPVDQSRTLSIINDLTPGSPQLQGSIFSTLSPFELRTLSSPEEFTVVSRLSAGIPIDSAISEWFNLLAGDADLHARAPRSHSASSEPLRDAIATAKVVSSSNAHDNNDQQDTSGVQDDNLASRNETLRLRDTNVYRYPWFSTDVLTLKPSEVVVFNHFVNITSLWIGLFDPLKHYSTYVPHLALHNVGLLNAILALSFRHLCLLGDKEPAKTYAGRNDAVQYYYNALQYVQRAMRHDSYNTSDELLATCLIISAYEMMDGSRRDWERHLHGVFLIQRSQVIHGDSKGMRSATWWAWLCQDIWAAFRERRKPFTFWKPLRKYTDMNCYEMAARSVYLMAQVVAYCAQEEIDKGERDIQARIKLGENLAKMLDQWERFLQAEFSPLPFASHEAKGSFKPIFVHPAALSVATQLYHAARILLILYKPALRGFDTFVKQRKQISGHIETICGLAKTTTDLASSIMSSQCLFIAGLSLDDARKREEVVSLLDDCHTRVGWPIKSLSVELKATWDG